MIVMQRVRNRIIEYLECASSYQDQREYQAHQVCHVPGEMINQWEDSVYADIDAYAPPVFSQDEQAAMRRFQAAWESVCDDTPNPLPDLEVLIGTEPWDRLRAAAEAALRVFARRGKLDEEREIV